MVAWFLHISLASAVIRNSPETVPTRHRLFVEWFSRCGAASVAGIGASVLVGWAFDVEALQSVAPGFATMKANTALAFLLTGCSILCTHARTASLERAGRVLAVAVLLVGGATVGEYLLNVNLGIDELLFAEADSRSPYPGRLAPATAIAIAITGMPHLSGRLLADRLAASRPGLKVLFMSGYTEDHALRHGVQDATIPFLQKPFYPADLTAAVRRALDS